MRLSACLNTYRDGSNCLRASRHPISIHRCYIAAESTSYYPLSFSSIYKDIFTTVISKKNLRSLVNTESQDMQGIPATELEERHVCEKKNGKKFLVACHMVDNSVN
ncbi:PREDICTED: uncharacterized protein LOC105143055 [Acromyrmex echinatior]|uniref:uncharacterized protein LOC105143055 n=1 Tax=Acromyrmex echinatior TaxID=103372 RepID=UPI000580C9E9|nr:PREDICTED: uncharacterized protein LOC105143055 [Acromyrmex echinatior]